VREFSSVKVSGFFEQQRWNLPRSHAWWATIDRLAKMANADHPRAGGRLVRLSVEEIEELEHAGWDRDRPRAWDESKRGSDPERGNAHAQAYLRVLRRAGERFLGTADAADWIHRDCVQRGDYLLGPPSVPGPSFGGPVASGVDVFFSGASGATSAREWAWYPYRREYLSGNTSLTCGFRRKPL
jgi:hypothetical protein